MDEKGYLFLEGKLGNQMLDKQQSIIFDFIDNHYGTLTCSMSKRLFPELTHTIKRDTNYKFKANLEGVSKVLGSGEIKTYNNIFIMEDLTEGGESLK